LGTARPNVGGEDVPPETEWVGGPNSYGTTEVRLKTAARAPRPAAELLGILPRRPRCRRPRIRIARKDLLRELRRIRPNEGLPRSRRPRFKRSGLGGACCCDRGLESGDDALDVLRV